MKCIQLQARSSTNSDLFGACDGMGVGSACVRTGMLDILNAHTGVSSPLARSQDASTCLSNPLIVSNYFHVATDAVNRKRRTTSSEFPDSGSEKENFKQKSIKRNKTRSGRCGN